MSANIPPNPDANQLLALLVFNRLNERLDRLEASIEVLSETLFALAAKTSRDPQQEMKLKAAFAVSVDTKLRNREQACAARPETAEVAELLKRLKGERES